MCRSRYSWINFLVVTCFVCFAEYSTAKIWSSVGYVYRFNSSNNDSKEYDTSKCDLKVFQGMEEDGDSSARRDYLKVKQDSYDIVFNYGENFKDNFFADGVFKYAQRVKFNVPENYRAPLISALKKSLSAGNCDIAQTVLDTLVNGKVQNAGQDNEFLGFENGDDKCAISKDGSTACAFNKAQTDEDGNPIIGICGETNCDRDTLDNYAGAKQKEGNAGGNSNTGKEGLSGGGVDERRGSGGNNGSSSSGGNSGSSSAGTGGSNGGSGRDESGSGNGKGEGTSVGKGEGKGEKETGNGDVNYPTLEEFDLRKVFQEMKKSQEGYIQDVSLSPGQCPQINISFNSKFLNINQDIDVHCRVFKASSALLGSLFLFIWGIISLRVILSA
ncbi:hypothetical protein OQ257_11425 [Actinobacillus equuli subsp. equuli]|uniref:Uncharacterized protein n=1 Tax=Actinobacillus equuli subsp. equuli TaxID=202947 RepID=A0A9X4G5T5_ACTEU|nr:hypothetical protein [Actinobacillus equuli]MDE8035766.1 hypothetical protein [Actinobacillus equuli subsp. equuli]